MTYYKKFLTVIIPLAVFTLFIFLNYSLSQAATTDVAKGQFGRVTPIADNNHPNLYYNQSEVLEMRNMILVQKSPQALVDLYNNKIKNAIARPAVYDEFDVNNMEAAMNYMIEPTGAKADALRVSLLSYKAMWSDGILDWYSTGGCHGCGYFLPWIFDLLQAYNPEKLSAAEITSLKNWFKLSADRLRFNTRDICQIAQDANTCIVGPTTTREGKTMDGFPNWFSRFMGPALAAALVSGNQSSVDYWADSGWPHDLFTFNGVTKNGTFPSDQANRYDLVMYLQSVYPSGANTDTYDREGFNVTNKTWNTTSYCSFACDGGTYHNGAMVGAIFAAEMAYHNGMTEVYAMTDVPGTEPALLRTFKRSIASRYETDLRSTSKTGHPLLWHDPLLMFGYRRYSDPAFDTIAPLISVDEPCGMQCGPEAPDPIILTFFGYPRRAAWTAGGTNPTPAPSPSPSPLMGDLNLDHIVNSLDWSLMNKNWFTNNTTADLNKDGIVNTIDFSLMNANWFKTW